ncbi:hypothetical protein J7E24_07855 [Hymenobacter sp. ISL-91]|uniref:hypothetical protein n=1 Tax=Hymenobacter sp. ISL-91 TaxID=2819151 RepID=UPI001BE6762F|nr:hypothetical protein [Hymenobacter sp. ISL-91]MBT2557694.1 hypothetical protein [Hymenobacter sp. ISL-91]
MIIAFFGLISLMLSRMGWGRLAGAYAEAAVPAALNRELLSYVRIGPVKYNNAVRAGSTPQGVWLTTWRILYIGHPPLFIPWGAFGPVQEETFLWVKTYTVYLQCPGGAVRFQFTSEQLRAALSAAGGA